MALKRRSRTQHRRSTPKQKAKRAGDRRTKRHKRPDLQARVFRVFAAQADSLWSGFADQCRQFAEGFNDQLGTTELIVEADATTVRATYPKGERELLVTLDKAERYVQCWVNTGCGTEGCCGTSQPPVGMMVRDNALHFAFGGEAVTDERLAIALLTQLTSGNAAEQLS